MSQNSDKSHKERQELIRETARISISGITLVACFSLLFFSDADGQQKIAAGLIGTVVGYWLK